MTATTLQHHSRHGAGADGRTEAPQHVSGPAVLPAKNSARSSVTCSGA